MLNSHYTLHSQCWDSGTKEVADGKPQQLLTWVIDCIGNVSRVYPVEGREHLLGIFKPIQTILTNTIKPEMLTARLEESCIRALIWTGHHLQVREIIVTSRFLNRIKLTIY